MYNQRFVIEYTGVPENEELGAIVSIANQCPKVYVALQGNKVEVIRLNSTMDYVHQGNVDEWHRIWATIVGRLRGRATVGSIMGM